MTKPELPQLVDVKCTNYECGRPGIVGPCEYDADINDDYTPCKHNCCEQCRAECAMEI